MRRCESGCESQGTFFLDVVKLALGVFIGGLNRPT